VGTFGIYALQRAFKSIITPAVAFESQLAEVSTMLDKTAMSILPEYEKGLRRMSVEFGESTETLSKGLYDILSASIPPAKALNVLEVSAKAATAGITDTGVAADAITTIINAYGLSAEDAGTVSDKLFAVVRRGKTTFAELAPAIGKAAATSAIAGLSLDELGATIATVTRAGIRTDEAMTAITGVIRSFLKPADDAKKAAKSFGIELSTDTLRAIGLRGVLLKLADATAEQTAAMFPNIRGLKGVAAALQDAEGYAEDYKLMLNSVGLTEEAYQKRAATTGFQLNRLKELYNLLKVTIGEHFLPDITELAEKTINWYEANKKLVEIKIEEWVNRAKLAVEAFWPVIKELAGWIGQAVEGWALLFELFEKAPKTEWGKGIPTTKEIPSPEMFGWGKLGRGVPKPIEVSIGYTRKPFAPGEFTPYLWELEDVKKDIKAKAEEETTEIVRNQVAIRSNLIWKASERAKSWEERYTKDFKTRAGIRMMQWKAEYDSYQKGIDAMLSTTETWKDRWHMTTEDLMRDYEYFTQTLQSSWVRTFDLMSYEVLTFENVFKNVLHDILASFSRTVAEMIAEWAKLAMFGEKGGKEGLLPMDWISSLLEGGEIEGGEPYTPGLEMPPLGGTSKIARGGDTNVFVVDQYTAEKINAAVKDYQENYGI